MSADPEAAGRLGRKSAFACDHSTGMTLREYYAGQAMAGLLASHAGQQVDGTTMQLPDDNVAAKWAVGFADALLARLTSPQEGPANG